MTATANDSATDPAPDPIALLLTAFEGFFELGLDPRTHAELGRRSGCGVSWIELDLLRFLRASGPVTVSELARASRRRGPAVLRALQVLQTRGFVVRRHDPYDRRMLRVHLTPQGEMADAHRLRALREVAQDTLVGWTPEEIGTLSTLFRRCADTAMSRVPDEAPTGSRAAR